MCALMAVVLCAAPGRAERSWDEPWLGEGDIEEVARALSLTDDQKSLLAQLQGAYGEQLQSAVAKMNGFFEAYWRMEERGLAGPRERREYTRVWNRYRDHAEALRERFVSDLMLVLNPEQAAAWEGYERARLRRECIEQCSVTGGQVDPRAIVEQAGLEGEEAAAAQAVLETHERGLDDVVRQWQNDRREGARGWARQMSDEERERWSADRQRRERALHVRIARVHDQAVRSLVLAVSEQKGQEILDAAYRASWPWLYDDVDEFSQIEHWIERDDMTPEQVQAIKAVLERGRTGLKGYNVRLIDEVRAWEAKADPDSSWWDDGERSEGEPPGRRVSAPMAVWNARADYLRRVFGEAGELLNSEQKASLRVSTPGQVPLRLPKVEFEEP